MFKAKSLKTKTKRMAAGCPPKPRHPPFLHPTSRVFKTLLQTTGPLLSWTCEALQVAAGPCLILQAVVRVKIVGSSLLQAPPCLTGPADGCFFFLPLLFHGS
ncbi:hypothetical protein LR48_Vigan238s008900 [Vigna angularis]|uniref:Uncharacterized protein n=1 Tax=Phaseolus angularis TaxID=3914 RepID=A0A0L9T7A7_PHAAN|nr:hypothetical protein LR48_Vigan238s008900 [Vigna angularis]